MQTKINPDLISLRDLSEEDIPSVLNYWFHSPEGFIESMGVDPNKMPKESEMEKNLRERLVQNRSLPSSKLSALAIIYDGRAIGVHSLVPLVEGDFGIFHAHIWNPEMRRKGICLKTYPLACQLFMKRFDLKRMLFKTPIQNIGSIRVKEKLGIRSIGEEVISFSIVKDGTVARVFELTRAEAGL